MRKLFLSLIAVLLLAGVSFAQNMAFDPTTGSAQVLTSVYNNSASTLDVGDVVVWDFSSSTGDNDAYVKTTTTADTVLVAGVVWPADIAAYDRGSILVYGIGTCDTKLLEGKENGPLCTTTTAGSGTSCPNLGIANYGFCTATPSASSCTCFVNAK